MSPDLARRLLAVGLDPERLPEPALSFRALFAAYGERATLLDRYELEALHRGGRVDDLGPSERGRLWQDVLAVRYPQMEVLGSGRGEPIEVVEYDPRWPKTFSHWKSVLADRLGEHAVRIEHIGSTAVPGLAAKPVIDILISVRDLDEEGKYVPVIEALGIQMRSREPGHRYFRPRPGLPRTVQIHACESGSRWEKLHVQFRDLLRTDNRVRSAYAALKRELAVRFRDDRIAYNEGKTAFILDVLAMEDVDQRGNPSRGS